QRLVGGVSEVLIQRSGPLGSVGLSERYRRVRVDGRHARGSFVRAIVRRIERDALIAEPLHD
ncbi:MAG: hypothetical protein JNL94_13970, partial [Planctomycetes bacterium]|nr:hypothetical protein [Planctomycetota bacterium]